MQTERRTDTRSARTRAGLLGATVRRVRVAMASRGDAAAGRSPRPIRARPTPSSISLLSGWKGWSIPWWNPAGKWLESGLPLF